MDRIDNTESTLPSTSRDSADVSTEGQKVGCRIQGILPSLEEFPTEWEVVAHAYKRSRCVNWSV